MASPPKKGRSLEERIRERWAIRAELATLTDRARDAGMRELATMLEVTLAVECPPNRLGIRD